MKETVKVVFFEYLLFNSDITGLIESNYSELTMSDTPELSAFSI